MRMLKLGFAAALSAATLTLTFAAVPAQAQRSVFDPGNYWEVGMVEVEDGQFENYMDYLSGNWKKQQEWAKSKGYLSDYFVLYNSSKRKGEPDLYLVTVYPKMPTPAEEQKMQDEFVAMMGKDEHVLDNESAGRVKMRTLAGDQLLRELVFKKAVTKK